MQAAFHSGNMSQTLFLKGSLTAEGHGEYFIPSYMVVGSKENVYKKPSTRQLQNHACEVLLVSGMCDCIQSLLQTMFSFTYCIFFLGMSLLILRAGYLIMYENHKHFMSSFCYSCMLCICTHLYTH